MSNLQFKKSLSHHDLIILESEMEKHRINKAIAFLLWFFCGVLGAHRYYMNDIGYAVAMTLTLGGFGVWAFVDLFFISARIDTKTEEKERQVLMSLGTVGRNEDSQVNQSFNHE